MRMVYGDFKDEHLQGVLQLFQDMGLHISLDKSSSDQSSTLFLGYVVSKKGLIIRLFPDHLTASTFTKRYGSSSFIPEFNLMVQRVTASSIVG